MSKRIEDLCNSDTVYTQLVKDLDELLKSHYNEIKSERVKE